MESAPKCHNIVTSMTLGTLTQGRIQINFSGGAEGGTTDILGGPRKVIRKNESCY